jgi:hypothetical protein
MCKVAVFPRCTHIPTEKDFSMYRRQLTLIEVLQPQSYGSNPARSRVTRTILQPEFDAFDEREAEVPPPKKSAPARRHAGRGAQQMAAV